MTNCRRHSRPFTVFFLVLGVTLTVSASYSFALAQSNQDGRRLTPLQQEIEEQRIRLGSSEVEDRREAVTRLRGMHHPDASRAALSALSDPTAIVRATAVSSISLLPAEERAASLMPLLSDKDEFVRRETAYALGKTRSRTSVSLLIERLLTDKQDGVRGAAAVALGEIADSAAVASLSTVLNQQVGQPTSISASKKTKKSKKEQNPFVRRAAAHSLGQIGSNAALPVLLAVLQDEKSEDDIRREAALALGRIGDQAALPALREAQRARDPYLSQAALDATRRILKAQPGAGS
jgi:HEAT repeat protein